MIWTDLSVKCIHHFILITLFVNFSLQKLHVCTCLLFPFCTYMHNKETETFFRDQIFRNWNQNPLRIRESPETKMSNSGKSSKTSQTLTDFIWRRSCTWTLLSARKMKMSRHLAFLYDSFSVISAQMNLLWLQGHYAISCFTMCTMLFENA